MKNFFSRIFNIDSFVALWVPVVLLILIFSLSSCDEEDYPDTDKIYDAVEACGYDSMREFIREYYDIDDIFEREEIMDEAIGNGWVEDYIAENIDVYEEGYRVGFDNGYEEGLDDGYYSAIPNGDGITFEEWLEMQN